MLPECYRTTHTSALNKIAARLPEAREFIGSFEPARSLSENARIAFQNRWYGNATQQNCSELTAHFSARFNAVPGHFRLMRRFILGPDTVSFPIINHLYMLLADPYYRWAAAEYLPERSYQQQQLIVPAAFEAALRHRLPPSVGSGSSVRYARNILAALRDNGLLSGKAKKTLATPELTIRALAYMLYAQSDFGIGVNEFDGSPVHASLLKPREMFVSHFQEGERLGYWEFTGDRTRLTAHLRLTGLAAWLEADSS